MTPLFVRFEREDGRKYDDRWHVLDAVGGQGERWTARCGKQGYPSGDTRSLSELFDRWRNDRIPSRIHRECRRLATTPVLPIPLEIGEVR